MSDTELTAEQKADLETWDSGRCHQPPWPFKTRLLSREERVYLEKLREERRIAAREKLPDKIDKPDWAKR